MATELAPNQQNTGSGGINAAGERVSMKAGGDIVAGNQTNITNNYLQSQTDERRTLLAEAEALFAQLPTDELPPHKTPPSPSRTVYGRNPNFVGRRAELLELAQQVKDGRHVAIAATGLGGIGKSQLAIEFVHRYGQFFAGGVYWISMAQPEVVPTELAQCGARLAIAGINDLPQPELVERVKQAWETPLPRLLIFDNCEDEALYGRYKPATSNCRILLTSRNGDWSANVQMMALLSLPRADSQTLLTTLCGRLTADEADQIANELGDYPLALHLAGSFLRRYKRLAVPNFLTQLQSDTLQHQALRHHKGVKENPSGHDWDVARTFEISFNQLAAGEGGADDDGQEGAAGRWPLADGEEPMDTNDSKPAASRQSPAAPNEIDTLARDLLARAAHFAPGEPIPVDLLWLTVDEADEMVLQDGVQRLVGLGLLEDEGTEEGDGEQLVQMHRLLVQFVQGVTAREGAQEAVEDALYLEADKLNEAGYPLVLRPWVIHLQFVTDEAVGREASKAADLCNELGYHIQANGDYEGARPYYEEALSINREVLGERHPDTAGSLNNLGALLQAQGEYGGARPYFEESLSINREVLGERHPDTALSLNNLGALLDAMGEYGGARPYYEEALSINREVLGERHPDTARSLNNLGYLLQAQGDYGGARPYYEEALSIRKEVLGERHPDTARSLNNLGYLLRVQGDYGGARPYYEEALSINREVLGERHPDTATSIWWMAIYAERDGDLVKAKSMYEHAHSVFQETLGDAHPTTKNVKGYLDRLLVKINQS